MRAINIIIVMLLSASSPNHWLPFRSTPKTGGSQDDFTSVVWGKHGSHRYQVVMSKRPFVYKNHKITWKWIWFQGEMRLKEYVDGYLAYYPDSDPESEFGPDKDLRCIHTELYRFRVVVDGQEWSVPRRIWRACFDPALEFTTPRLQLVRPDVLKITAYCGDAAGAYSVTWTIRRNGHCGRKFDLYGN